MEWITKIILISAFTGILAGPISDSPAENDTCTTDSSESSTPISANFTDTNSTNQSTDSTNTTAGISTVESQMLQSKSVAKKDIFSEPGTTVITMSFDSSSIAKEIVDDNASQSASIEITTEKSEESQRQKDYVESASHSEMPVSEIVDSSSSPETYSAPQISSMNGSSTDQVSSSSANLKQYSSSQFTTVEPSKEFSSVADVSEKFDEEKSDVLHSAIKRSLEAKSVTSLATEREGISDPQTTLPANKSKEHSEEHATETYSEGELNTNKHQSELTFSPSLPTGDSSFLYSTADLSKDSQFSETSVFSTVAKLSADGTTTPETTFTYVPESKTETAPVNISESSVRAHTEEPKDQNEDSNQAPEISVSHSTAVSEDNNATNTESDVRNTASSSINAETAVNKETNDITHSPEEISKDSTSETQTVFETHSSIENAGKKTSTTPKVDEWIPTEENKTNLKPEIRSRGERSSESKISEIRVLPSEASAFLGDSIIKEKSSSATTENRDLGYTSGETVILSNNSTTNENNPQENVSASVVPFAKSEHHTTVSSNTSGSSASRDTHHTEETIRRSQLSEVHATDYSTKTSTLSSQYSLLPMRDKTTPEITTLTSHDPMINNTSLNKSNMSELKTISQPEIIRDIVVPDAEFSNSNILPTDENSASLMATSKEEWSSSMNSVATEIPSVKFQDLDTLSREHISNSVLDSKMGNGLATENINIQETSQTSLPETEKDGSVHLASPTMHMDEMLLNYSPSESVYKEEIEANTKIIQERKPTRTATVDQDQLEKERFSVAEHTDGKISNHSSTFSSHSTSNSYPVSSMFVQPTQISFENSSNVSAITENRVQLMASDVETSDVIDSGELPVAPLIPVNLHPTPESNKTTITFVPVNESTEIPFINSSTSEEVGAISGKVSGAESRPGHNNENLNSAFTAKNQDSNNSSTVRVEVKTSISEAPPLQKTENYSEITTKVIGPPLIEASATPKTEQQNSESPSPPAEEPPIDSTNSSGIAPTPSSTETTTRRFAIRKPKIRLNGDSDTFTTSAYARRIATSTRKPTPPNSGPPVSIFRKNRTRIGYITSSTTPRTTAAYSIRRASFRPVHIVGTETFPFSLPPMTTLPTPTTTEEEEEEEEEEIEEDIVELKEDHSTNEGQVPTISEDEDIIVIKYSASLVVNKGIRWKKQLNSRPSPEYKREEKRMRQTLERIFRGSSVGPSIYKVEIDGFSEKYPKSRLIIVDYSVYVRKTDNPPNTADLIQAFNERLVNDSFSRYTFSPENTFIEYLSEERLNKPTESPEMEPPIPQWAIAVIVIGAASFIFIVLFAAVTVYGRHHMRRRYTSKLDDELERSVDSRDWEKKLGTAAAYENLAADVVYDVDDCGTGVDNVKRSYFLD